MPSSLHSLSRKPSTVSTGTSIPAAPTTFFFASEQEIESGGDGERGRDLDSTVEIGPVSQAILATKDHGGERKDAWSRDDVNTSVPAAGPGVQQLQDALDAAFGDPTGRTKHAVSDHSLSRQSSGRSNKTDRSNGSEEVRRKRKRKDMFRSDGASLLEHEHRSGVATPRHEVSSTNSSPSNAQALHRSPRLVRRPSATAASIPMTPLHIDSPVYRYTDSAMPGTPKSLSLHSLRLSDNGSGDHDNENDANSQAIASSDDDEDDGGDEKESVELQRESFGSAPELVIPSLAMPARRPFTDRGKALGRLKIMVTGSAGIGKSGLIRAIVRGCEDIVHVDPLPVKVHTASHSGKKGARQYMEELSASTRAYPSWWSDVEGSRFLRRRKSMGLGDTVLERNVCFVDSKTHEGVDTDSAAFKYLEQVAATYAGRSGISETDAMTQLSGGGAPMVDVVLYLFGHDAISETELSQFDRLSTLANVIPVIAKSDLLSPIDTAVLKRSVLDQLIKRHSAPFLFGKSGSELVRALDQIVHSTTGNDEATQTVEGASSLSTAISTDDDDQPKSSARDVAEKQAVPSELEVYPPFAISSAPGPDLETMDASLLMSADYCPPPIPSDLDALIRTLFDPDNAAWLRHSAARKIVAWQRSTATAQLRKSSADTGASDSTDIIESKRAEFRSLLSKLTDSSRVWPTGTDETSDLLRALLNRNLAMAADRRLAMPLPGQSRQDSPTSRRARRAKRLVKHWSETQLSSAESSQSLQDTRPTDVLDMATRFGNVLVGIIKVVGGVSAVGIFAAVVAKTVFGVQGVEIVTVGSEWRWTITMGDARV